MKTIEINDDIYDYLIQNVKTLGEDPSSILSRLLGLDDTAPNTLETEEPAITDACLHSPEFKAASSTVDRFLQALSWLYSMNRKGFAQILHVKGKKRVYFAEREKDISSSGNNAFPKKIPNTPYWVITNSNTQTKQRLLSDVMRVLGYSIAERNRLAAALKD